MSTVPDPESHEAPEVRDGEEIHEHNHRQALPMPMTAGWPCTPDGHPMAIVTGSSSDKVPTVQYGNVVVGPVTIQRLVPARTIQEVIDGARETQRAAEFVVGVERRLLQWAVDPKSRVASPVTAEDAFAAPPSGYDPSVSADPRVIQEQQMAAQAAADAFQAQTAAQAPPAAAPTAQVAVNALAIQPDQVPKAPKADGHGS